MVIRDKKSGKEYVLGKEVLLGPNNQPVFACDVMQQNQQIDPCLLDIGNQAVDSASGSSVSEAEAESPMVAVS